MRVSFRTNGNADHGGIRIDHPHPGQSDNVGLSRLIHAGVITRAAHGWYENPFSPPSPEEKAMVLRYPSYLSLEYALSKQGILSQGAQTLTLMTTKLPYTYTTTQVVYEYHQIKKGLIAYVPGGRMEGIED
jgi:hypothetical protein